jgi:hypothetical protein
MPIGVFRDFADFVLPFLEVQITGTPNSFIPVVCPTTGPYRLAK